MDKEQEINDIRELDPNYLTLQFLWEVWPQRSVLFSPIVLSLVAKADNCY